LTASGPPPLPATHLGPARPRIWSAIMVAICGIFAALVVASFFQGMALVFLAGSEFDPENLEDLLDSLAKAPWAVWISILPGQLAFAAATIGAAILSPEPMRARLGYTASLLPWWSLPLLLGGTLFAGLGGGLLLHALGIGPGMSLRFFMSMARNAEGWNLVAFTCLISIVPAVVEESLFRGYVQRRLLQRWSPLAAIGSSTLLFVLAHFDPSHIVAVVPLGAWLGIIAWRANALWPGMVCHAAQNALAVWNSRRYNPEDELFVPETFILLGVSGALTIGAIWIMRRTRPNSDGLQPTA
jgi:membrane protease YdiL (CAAX protease family)